LTVATEDASLTAGPYIGRLRIEFKSKAAKNRFIDVPVSLTILPSTEVVPNSLEFDYPGAVSQQLTVSGTTTFTVSTDHSKWLRTAVRGQTIIVSVKGTAVNPGATYTATVIVRDESGTEIRVPITFRVVG
jgi:hypothetical protein